MNKQDKNQVIEVLKEKFSQYNNFYITNTESLTVDQVSKLRRICFDKNVHLKVAKNTPNPTDSPHLVSSSVSGFVKGKPPKCINTRKKMRCAT